MTLGSLFDGSGGFPLAAILCGIEPIWASEVEIFPISVTKKRFPHMKHLGDVKKINGAKVEPVDVITFGSPCQDLSVAGNRAGLDGERSGLFMEAIRIIKEMRTATNGKQPAFIVWENVSATLQAEQDAHVVCIAGNTIDRQLQNGGNGVGAQEDISYTLNTMDRHAVLASGGEVTGTLMANCATKQWLGNQKAFSGDYFPIQNSIVRRLTPLECCRLQGFPDWWCDGVEGSDAAQYKMWGNGVALPCILYVMEGIAEELEKRNPQQTAGNTKVGVGYANMPGRF